MEQLIAKQPKRLPLRSAHPYHMYDMINETPAALERILNEEIKTIKQVANTIVSRDIKNLLLIGIGTSYHACLVAKYFFRTIANINAEAYHSFNFILDSPLSLYDPKSTGVIIFSHRGVKTYSYQTYCKCKELGLYTVLLTSLESVIEEPLDAIIRTSRGEQSSAFTISHSCSTFSTLLMANELAKLRNLSSSIVPENEIKEIPKKLELIFNTKQEDIKQWCKFIKESNCNQFYFMGYSVNESNAHEVALKINEASWDYASGFNLEQYIHGPFVSTGPSQQNTFNTCSTFIIGSISERYQEAIKRTQLTIKTVLNVGGKVTVILPESDQVTPTFISSPKEGIVIRLPEVKTESLSHFTNLYTLQLITYYLSLERGTNPDSFKRDQPLHDTAFSKSGLIL